MKLLFAASEVFPFAKTGGLADVVGALPQALHDLGEEVAIVLPLYRKVRARKDPLTVVARRVSCPFAGGNRPFRLLKTPLPGRPEIPVYLIENPGIFEAEDALYGTEPGSYGDGHLRFLYFSRAVLRVPEAAKLTPDVFHLHDWQTALIPPLLRTVHRDHPVLSKAASVLTIHNLAYQGAFPDTELRHAGIPDFLISEGRLLERGTCNLLAGGIRFADALSTVSRSYAKEILGEEFGAGLDPVLRWREDHLHGIVNGLDVEQWDPARDPAIAAPYDAEDRSGKAVCRRALLEEAGLPDTEGPVLGIVSRLVSQKGFELVIPVMRELLPRDPKLRLVVLGSGEPDLEDAFSELARQWPGQCAVKLGFDAPYSSRIEAGADIFLMPSRFEPCGLNQLISMRYGTVPVVRAVGGLKDSVTPYDPDRNDPQAKGFVFEDATPAAFAQALHGALRLFYEQRERFLELGYQGMITDWSWKRSAKEYQALYAEACERHADPGFLASLTADLPPEPLELELPPLAEIPERYERDVLILIPRDPKTLFARWTLRGEGSDAWLRDLGDDERAAVHFEFVLKDETTGASHGQTVGRDGHLFLGDVEPGHRYSAELYAHRPHQPGHRLMGHPPLLVPPGYWPRS